MHPYLISIIVWISFYGLYFLTIKLMRRSTSFKVSEENLQPLLEPEKSLVEFKVGVLAVITAAVIGGLFYLTFDFGIILYIETFFSETHATIPVMAATGITSGCLAFAVLIFAESFIGYRFFDLYPRLVFTRNQSHRYNIQKFSQVLAWILVAAWLILLTQLIWSISTIEEDKLHIRTMFSFQKRSQMLNEIKTITYSKTLTRSDGRQVPNPHYQITFLDTTDWQLSEGNERNAKQFAETLSQKSGIPITTAN